MSGKIRETFIHRLMVDHGRGQTVEELAKSYGLSIEQVLEIIGPVKSLWWVAGETTDKLDNALASLRFCIDGAYSMLRLHTEEDAIIDSGAVDGFIQAADYGMDIAQAAKMKLEGAL